jgi:TMEM175 potassium channel family protein
MTKTRLEAFSDGVIAIIITIMVLELKAPHGTDWKNDLQPLLPVFISYVASFTMLGIYWVNHHHLIHTIKEMSGGIMWANLHLLFWLSLVPFATAWMGENHFDSVTVAAYAFLSDLCGLAYYILMQAIKKCNQHNTALIEVLKRQSRKGLLSFIPYTLAIPAAFINVSISGALVILVAFFWLMPDKNIEKSLKE